MENPLVFLYPTRRKPIFTLPEKHKSTKDKAPSSQNPSHEPELEKSPEQEPGESSKSAHDDVRWDKRDSKSGKFVGGKVGVKIIL